MVFTLRPGHAAPPLLAACKLQAYQRRADGSEGAGGGPPGGVGTVAGGSERDSREKGRRRHRTREAPLANVLEFRGVELMEPFEESPTHYMLDSYVDRKTHRRGHRSPIESREDQTFPLRRSKRANIGVPPEKLLFDTIQPSVSSTDESGNSGTGLGATTRSSASCKRVPALGGGV